MEGNLVGSNGGVVLVRIGSHRVWPVLTLFAFFLAVDFVHANVVCCTGLTGT